jgi:arginine-tRNA-protein transferase
MNRAGTDAPREVDRGLLERALVEHAIPPGPAFPCPYLTGREARNVSLVPQPLRPGVYHALMDLNFRRLGSLFYRPHCHGCQSCRMLRVPVAEFRPSRAQRRCHQRNRDLEVRVAAPGPSPERLALYRRYLQARHYDGQMDGSEAEFEGFLYDTCLATIEVSYYRGAHLVAVGIADVEPRAMSLVYCYYEPEMADRSLGVFNVLWSLAECRRRGLGHLYLGYHVEGSPKMAYKAAFRPCEVRSPSGGFRRLVR